MRIKYEELLEIKGLTKEENGDMLCVILKSEWVVMMKRIVSLIVCAVMLFSVVVIEGESEAAETVKVHSDLEISYEYIYDGMSDFEAQVFLLTNKERVKNGLKEFKAFELLDEANDIRASEIVGKFSHDRPDGSSCFTVIPWKKLGFSNIGENIAAGQFTPEEVVQSWMNSEGHRQNILNPKFTHLGVGHINVPDTLYKNYWVQLFIGSSFSPDGEYIVKPPTTTTTTTTTTTATTTTTTPPEITGDIDGDNTLTVADFVLLLKILTYEVDATLKADINNDEKVNVLDMAILKHFFISRINK